MMYVSLYGELTNWNCDSALF